MIYVVEIMGPTGGRARKEYVAFSMRHALQQVFSELEDYPKCEVVDIIPCPDLAMQPVNSDQS